MKNVKLMMITLIMCLMTMTSCLNSPTDKAQSSVKSYLKDNLIDNESYKPISFSNLDTLETPDTLDNKLISLYEITHNYSIVNSEKENIKMTISFYLDKDLKVNDTNTKSINGDYGSIAGNCYWEYNSYVGNKTDAGSMIFLYSLDSIRGILKYETTADINGNYKIEKIPSGKYFLIVRSENTTDCPDGHLLNLRIYNDEIKQLFGFDIEKYKTELKKIERLDSLSSVSLLDDKNTLKSWYNYTKYSEQSRDKTNELIKILPDKFKHEIYLFNDGYSNAYYFLNIQIEEGETKNIITDFGNTCI